MLDHANLRVHLKGITLIMISTMDHEDMGYGVKECGFLGNKLWK